MSDTVLDKSTDAYLRIPFQVDDPASLDTLTMRTFYDDGFVAYVNGTEVARRNAPDGPVPAIRWQRKIAGDKNPILANR